MIPSPQIDLKLGVFKPKTDMPDEEYKATVLRTMEVPKNEESPYLYPKTGMMKHEFSAQQPVKMMKDEIVVSLFRLKIKLEDIKEDFWGNKEQFLKNLQSIKNKLQEEDKGLV
jgi:hypothetical protein